MATRTTRAKKAPALVAGQYVPQAGDIIFVRPAADDVVGQLVAEKTGGPYCHVRIRISADEVVEALPSGITRAFIHPPEPFASDCAGVGAMLERARVTAMATWLIQQEGRPYGWLSCVADALQALLPQRLGSRTPFLVAPSRYNCSQLAAVAIVSAGYPLPADMIADLPRVSPNSLARTLGVLK